MIIKNLTLNNNNKHISTGSNNKFNISHKFLSTKKMINSKQKMKKKRNMNEKKIKILRNMEKIFKNTKNKM